MKRMILLALAELSGCAAYHPAPFLGNPPCN
jgi:hypothetical protein